MRFPTLRLYDGLDPAREGSANLLPRRVSPRYPAETFSPPIQPIPNSETIGRIERLHVLQGIRDLVAGISHALPHGELAPAI